MDDGRLCIGLFGTCGESRWRKRFIDRYRHDDVTFFNPQVAEWKPELAVEEARHLATDAVILFPVTAETYGTGSLAECGFSILNAIRLDDRRDFVLLIEQQLNPELDDLVAARESLRARALVLEHLRRLALSNVYLVETLDQMLDVSLVLYQAAALRAPLGALNPHRLAR